MALQASESKPPPPPLSVARKKKDKNSVGSVDVGGNAAGRGNIRSSASCLFPGRPWEVGGGWLRRKKNGAQTAPLSVDGVGGVSPEDMTLYGYGTFNNKQWERNMVEFSTAKYMLAYVPFRFFR